MLYFRNSAYFILKNINIKRRYKTLQNTMIEYIYTFIPNSSLRVAKIDVTFLFKYIIG
jgi:hypothetical protein